MTEFDENYYKSQNYSSYLERQERYSKMMQELHHDLFRRVCLDFTEKYVLDYGCAVGFVVNSMKELGYKDVHGFDVSTWAVEWGKKNLNLRTLHNNIKELKSEPELMLALDVFEHMDFDQILRVFIVLKPAHVLIRIPITLVDGGRYVLDVSENDPTHKLRFSRPTWINIFKELGYDWMFNINTGLMYDTSGVMCALFRRTQYEQNNPNVSTIRNRNTIDL